MPYVQLAGERLWHTVDGDGDEPVVLLHGGFSSGAAFEPLVGPLVTAGYAVHRLDQPGHGRSPDSDGPYRYEAMAERVARFLDEVVGRPAHVVGWSDGAFVTMCTAVIRPELLSRIVVIGQYYDASGRPEHSIPATLRADAEAAMRFLRREYDPYTPDGPEHFPVVFEKTLDLWEHEPEFSAAQLGSIAVPALVLQGDRDEVSVAHGASVAESLGDGRFAVLPGTHGLPIESPEVVAALLVRFLQGVPPPAFG